MKNIRDPELLSLLNRLDAAEAEGRLNTELSQLSYSQLLTLSRVLVERTTKKPPEQQK